MRTWNVTITETLARTVAVEAEDTAGAEDVVRGMYSRCEIMLVSEDIIGAEIAAGQEGICPLCGIGIEYKGGNIIDDDGGTFPWTYPGCGASGKEGYSRRFSGHWDVVGTQHRRRSDICAG